MRNDESSRAAIARRSARHPPATDDEGVLVDVAKALAAFQETLASARTPFDEFRDALARGDRAGGGALSRGRAARAEDLHRQGRAARATPGPNFTNGEFHDTGLPFFAGAGPRRSGAPRGDQAGHGEPLQPAGPVQRRCRARHRDEHPARALEHRNFGEFKVPSLRNASFTAPYGHDGQLATLADVVRHYSELNLDRLHADGEQILKPLRLTAREQNDLVVFLETLSPFGNPWRPERWRPCE